MENLQYINFNRNIQNFHNLETRKNLPDLKGCMDLPVASEKKLLSLYNSYCEREENVFKFVRDKLNMTRDILDEAAVDKDFSKLVLADYKTRTRLLELANWMDKFWAIGRTLKIKFLGGSHYQRNTVIIYASLWQKYANIKFEFVREGNAEIRVAFNSDKGTWSYIGTDALNVSDISEPTMNFSCLDENSSEDNMKGAVLHEFGHCLGLINKEHSEVIHWNREAVYEYFRSTQNWDKESTDDKFFAEFSTDGLYNNDLDKDSIMMHPIPKAFTTDGFESPWKKELSQSDIKLIRKIYPPV